METNVNFLNATKLKIKQISLADEAKTIRRLEKPHAYSSGWNPIRDHRVKDVRWESRATHLARGYLTGRKYSELEKSRKPEKEVEFETRVLPRVKALIKKYSTKKKEFNDSWLNS